MVRIAHSGQCAFELITTCVIFNSVWELASAAGRMEVPQSLSSVELPEYPVYCAVEDPSTASSQGFSIAIAAGGPSKPSFIGCPLNHVKIDNIYRTVTHK